MTISPPLDHCAPAQTVVDPKTLLDVIIANDDYHICIDTSFELATKLLEATQRYQMLVCVINRVFF